MQASKAPPTRISTLASGTVKVSGQNQRLTCSAELHALKTVSRLAWKTREIFRGGGGTARSMLSESCAMSNSIVARVKTGLMKRLASRAKRGYPNRVGLAD